METYGHLAAALKYLVLVSVLLLGYVELLPKSGPPLKRGHCWTLLDVTNVVSLDLKLDNLCIDSEGHVRIIDFGMCKLKVYRKQPRAFCGTPEYMAPEIIRGLHYNQSVDWWSFGILTYEMLIGQSPFNGTDEDELFWSVCNEEAYYPRFLSREAKSMLVL
ncbi:putative cAMP-dependent protein kinase catalytic subunit, partial [Ixodes scapularis]